ncbi:hypothetical protein WI523_14675 [Gemmatimonadota bacterium CCK-12]
MLKILTVAAVPLIIVLVLLGARSPDIDRWDEALGFADGTSLVLVIEPRQVGSCNMFLDDFREYLVGRKKEEFPQGVGLDVVALVEGEAEVPSLVRRYFARMRIPANIQAVNYDAVGDAVPDVPLPAVFMIRDGSVIWHETVTHATSLATVALSEFE